MGLRPVLFASSERQRAWLEPQAGLPDLSGAGAESADQAPETTCSGEARRVGSSTITQPNLVNGLYGRSAWRWQGLPAFECSGRL